MVPGNRRAQSPTLASLGCKPSQSSLSSSPPKPPHHPTKMPALAHQLASSALNRTLLDGLTKQPLAWAKTRPGRQTSMQWYGVPAARRVGRHPSE